MKNAIIYLVLLVLILIIFELFNGFWFKSELEKNLLNLNALYSIDIEIDSNEYYKNSQKISYSRNNYGLRTDCEDTEDIDIVAIGASTTDQRYIDFENTFSYILQERLTENRESNYCVANAGVDGHLLSTHIDSFEVWFSLIPSFKPSYYLLNIGINDAALINHISEKFINNDNSFLSHVKFELIRNSYLYSFAKKIRNLIGISLDEYGVLTHKKNIMNDFEYTALGNTAELERDIINNSEIFGNNYKKIIKIIKDSDATPICITQEALFIKDGKGVNNAFPYKDGYLNGFDLKLSLDLINKQINQICTEKGAIIVNIHNGNFAESDFYDFVHHNPKGSIKLANIIFNSIKDKL